MRRKLFFLLPLLLACFLAKAQQFEIKGLVTSLSDGSPLPGVTITSKTNSVSTLSSYDGSYKIQVSDPETEVLVFSFMGFLIEEVAVKNLPEINVGLTEDIERESRFGSESADNQFKNITPLQKPNIFMFKYY